ncbi:alpha-hydroxy-acid oxidizing enzyme [Actinomadura sp. NBRC 104412]|uniref:alpha-hydroxy acid oxidase n=1 Tax=Actinomadura sp. NBRC 104412 TaxID=3032203 RepID=UPI0024A26269|nr:alpha-hydroxy acid oxidase [Actinomadura sp. NBRC 104412]GLZ02726.1 alpha-hydroxy-acid oxidizing enzyme [Actinomadura sp. NBRC 104412]
MDLRDLERRAAFALHPAVYDYYAGGAGEERTVEDNLRAWRRLRLRPRTMRDVSSVSSATDVLGHRVRTPVLVAPAGMQRLAHPEGELATAVGAAAAGAGMMVSTYSTVSLEEIAALTPPAPRWFQLYVLRDRGLTAELVRRAAASGYQGVVVTVDAAAVGDRPRDRRNGYWLPAGDLRAANLADASLSAYSTDLDDTVTPGDLAWVAETGGLPIAVKGVLRGDDAVACVDAGARGVIVSNHGGRQLDTAVASADALREVVDAVQGRAEVLVDGGVRSGTDVLKALALGARAVLVGRPVLWALATGGADGVRALLDDLTSELVRAMRLCGVTSPGEITPDLL